MQGEIVQKVIPTFHTVFHRRFVENFGRNPEERERIGWEVGKSRWKKLKALFYITTGIKKLYTQGYQPREMSRVA